MKKKISELRSGDVLLHGVMIDGRMVKNGLIVTGHPVTREDVKEGRRCRCIQGGQLFRILEENENLAVAVMVTAGGKMAALSYSEDRGVEVRGLGAR